MNFLQIPLQDVANQNVSVSLNGQRCSIYLNDMNGRQYMTVKLNGNYICNNVLLQSGFPVIGAAYTGFIGDFMVVDLQGNSYPVYSGWNDRWLLVYMYG